LDEKPYFFYNKNMYNFVNSPEFKAFCKAVGLKLDQVKTMKKQELLNLITSTNIDEKAFQIELSKQNIDPKILATFDKLGIPMIEQNKVLAKQGLLSDNVAMDYVLDSESVLTTFQEELAEFGIIFCSISEAVRLHPELVQKYLGSVVPFSDNYYASLNSAVFSDGSFCYIPPDTRCPMDLSTYFRINSAGTGQFERTLIIADRGSYVSYLEGCTAPQSTENQLHSAVVELIALEGAEIKYSTVQNWYAGDQKGEGGVYNFVTKRGICLGDNSKISWTQIETGSAITWKYPSVILKGNNSVGEFYSIAMTDNHQQADTGTKMIHIGKNTKSKIVSKSITSRQSKASYRGKVKISSGADNAKNYSQCDSLILVGEKGRFVDRGEVEKIITKLTIA
jgi:Fe-S cluster assembly protein SufB